MLRGVAALNRALNVPFPCAQLPDRPAVVLAGRSFRRQGIVLKMRPMPAEPQLVLLVDDDQGIRDALSELLRDEGFSVATAANGAEALSWLRAERPTSCTVLLDLMMPVMGGSEFLRAKRADATLTGLHVLVLTATGEPLPIDQMADIKGRLAKPIVLPDLMAALASCGDPASPSGKGTRATTAVAASTASPPSRLVRKNLVAVRPAPRSLRRAGPPGY